MTGPGYRWTASMGVFLGVVTTVVLGSTFLPQNIFDSRSVTRVFLLVSLSGVALSLVSLFLHPDVPDRESPLDHRAVGFIAVALNSWPWAHLFWMFW